MPLSSLLAAVLSHWSLELHLGIQRKEPENTPTLLPMASLAAFAKSTPPPGLGAEPILEPITHVTASSAPYWVLPTGKEPTRDGGGWYLEGVGTHFPFFHIPETLSPNPSLGRGSWAVLEILLPFCLSCVLCLCHGVSFSVSPSLSS